MNEQIGLEVITASSGDIHNFSYWIIVGVFVLLASIAILSSRFFRKPRLVAKHLFLKVPFLLKSTGMKQEGYIRSLDAKTIVLVTSAALSRGAILSLKLGQLPDFPNPSEVCEAKVTKIRSLGGTPSSYLVSLEVAEQNQSLQQTPIKTYLSKLLASS